MTQSLTSIRKLTVILMISGGCNILLIALIIYGFFREQPPTPYCESKLASAQQQLSPLAIDHSNSEVIRFFKKMPLEWLVARLNNTQLVENGYTQRDLALACLVTFHYFDLDRALAGAPPLEQKRSLVYGRFRDGRAAALTVYPGITEKQTEAIYAFATTEKWPLTSKGMFTTLHKQNTDRRESSLEDAFVMTPEFLAVEMLFSRSGASVDRFELINVLMQGSWMILEKFAEQQKISQDLSVARRQQFLLDYIQLHSKAATQLMLKTDEVFVFQKLDDRRVMMLLELLDEKTPENERFALSLLTSPRSDEVWKMAARRLYLYAGESMPDQYQHHNALSRFVPRNQDTRMTGPSIVSTAPPIIPPVEAVKPVVKTSTEKLVIADTSSIKPKAMLVQQPKGSVSVPSKPVIVTPKIIAKDLLYVIQDGDSLWKLSRRFEIDVDTLKSYNRLDSDVLRPGKLLKIPSKQKAKV